MNTNADYVPFGDRPEPYPHGFNPNPARWTGLELMRVRRIEDNEEPAHARDLAAYAPAPPDNGSITAKTSTRKRYLPADRLPASRLVLAEHITDDPGALALHGQRLRSGDVVTLTPDDTWTGSQGGLHEVAVGAVLVSVEPESDGTKVWRAWRVAPIGIPVMVFHEEKRPGARDHLPRLAALLDEDLRDAFAEILRRYRNSGADPSHVEQMERSIELWRLDAEMGRSPGRTRGRRHGARRPGTHTSRQCNCGNWSGAGSQCIYTPKQIQAARRREEFTALSAG